MFTYNEEKKKNNIINVLKGRKIGDSKNGTPVNDTFKNSDKTFAEDNFNNNNNNNLVENII